MAYYVCCLTRREVDAFVTHRSLPNCSNCNPEAPERGSHAHKHFSEVVAQVGTEYAIEDPVKGRGFWLGTRYRMCYLEPPKKWATVKGGMQLVVGVIGGSKTGRGRPLLGSREKREPEGELAFA